jgi:hypothetical protein
MWKGPITWRSNGTNLLETEGAGETMIQVVLQLESPTVEADWLKPTGRIKGDIA